MASGPVIDRERQRVRSCEIGRPIRMATLEALRLGSVVGDRARGLLSRWQRLGIFDVDKARANAYRFSGSPRRRKLR